MLVSLASNLETGTLQSHEQVDSNRYEALSTQIHQAHLEPGLAGCALGFCMLGPTGEVLVDENAQTALIPASALKTLTTATALQILGPEFHFQTKLLATSPVENGVITGDLIILGGGDPMLSLLDLEKWSGILKKQGISTIQGRILGDGRRFTGSLFNDYWDWGDIGNGYGSPVSGLNLEHNRYTVVFQPGATVGAPAKVLGVSPQVPGVQMINEVITGPPGGSDAIVIHGGERTPQVTFRGSVPVDMPKATVLGAVTDPEEFAAFHLRQILLKAGINVLGGTGSARGVALVGIPDQKPLLVYNSPPLLQIITSIHATSDNQETQCVYLQLGLQQQKPPDAIIRDHWRAVGIDFTALRMEDGCGLARADHIRPLDLAKLQYFALHGLHGEAYAASLLKNESLRWKGGAMSSIRSTTGYITDTGGNVYSFAFMVNHYTDKNAVNALRETIVKTISAW
jgi:serine-type D-Ala-D-Ala carboxypeptidase/endopeptidase (penicillin-binding protein 4)